MRLPVCLLLSLAAGAAVYLTGAVIWSTLDPKGAGVPLLFTIPLAITGTALPALIGMLGLINSGLAPKQSHKTFLGGSDTLSCPTRADVLIRTYSHCSLRLDGYIEPCRTGGSVRPTERATALREL